MRKDMKKLVKDSKESRCNRCLKREKGIFSKYEIRLKKRQEKLMQRPSDERRESSYLDIDNTPFEETVVFKI
jgi:hypothetical protein